MKLPIRSTSAAVLLGLTLLATSCSKSKKEDPKPTPVYHITVRMVGVQASGTTVYINSEYDFAGVRGKFAQGPVVRETYTTAAVDKTYDMGNFGDYDLVEVEMGQTTPLPAAGSLRADILVDGVVRATATMNNTSGSRRTVAVETDDL